MHYCRISDRILAQRAHGLITGHLDCYDSIPGLARKLGTNPTKLKVVFKLVYGESVFEFSRRVRMEKAKELLVTTDDTLQSIAEQVGYTEGNNFQAAFKKVVGCTPGEWRRMLGEGGRETGEGI